MFLQHYFMFALRYLLIVSLFALGACSSETVNKPTKLQKVKPEINLKRLWKASVGAGDEDLMLQLSPAILDEFIFTLDYEGQLFALDRSSGKRLWKRELNEQISGGLGADSSHLYYATFQGEIVCLDRNNGDEIWRQSLTSEAVSAPASNGQTVVVQTIDGKLFAFGAAEGSKRWRYDSVGPILSLRGTPTPLINKEYTITSFANGEMLAFEVETGRPRWKATIGLPQGRTELERLVDPDGQAVLEVDRIYTVAYQGKLVSLDLASGVQIWSKPFSSYNGVALSTSQTAASQLYVSTAEGDVVAVLANNSNEIWRNEKLKYRRLSTPVTFGETLVVSDLGGYLHFLSQVDGRFLARTRPDSDGVMGDMLVVDNTLYVHSRSGYLFAYRIVE